ncbi:hypothetical protein [Spiroplasma culicicola]|uniref:Uncharacterized protein n=1 Tax=Spiroplasma culicicola AES-1 TaxID=1276246 RepID=W6A6I5_9MOLU|nr:hypothetical protein [Spiroplasma culicicola]AHI52480.1 hypothetical protein SCULI_v1c01390 [Spiroplasma culicicola AES-1]
MTNFKLWTITSFEEYVNEWPSLANEFNNLTTYQQKLGYTSPEDFFIKNAFAAQELANQRVGNILERIFSTSDLHANVQEQLKKFTYKAIDHLRMNDCVIYQNTKTIQTNYNNGRSDSIENDLNVSLEKIIGDSAWRSWIGANIESLYLRYLKENDLPYLLDPEQFYNKKQIDDFFETIDWKIYEEHTYTTVHIRDLQKQINRKQEVTDQVLLQQKTDDEGNPIDEIEEVGYFDEILFQSFRPDSTIIDTDRGRKRAVINLNDTIGELINASVYQSSSESDQKNAIGRIWGWGIENYLKHSEETFNEKFKQLEDKILDINKNKWIIGEYKWVKVGTPIVKGWIKINLTTGYTLIAGTSQSTSTGSIKSHTHTSNAHNHYINGSGNYVPVLMGGAKWYKRNADNGAGDNKAIVSDTNNPNIANIALTDSASSKINSTGGSSNLAAGQYAELWEYVGIDAKGETLNTNLNAKLSYWQKNDILDKEYKDNDECAPLKGEKYDE